MAVAPESARDFAELCERFSPEVRRVASAARELIRSLDPDVTEVVWVLLRRARAERISALGR